MSRNMFLDLTGATVRGVTLEAPPKGKHGKKRAKKIKPPSTVYPGGQVIAEFRVEGRAVPWKVSIRKRGQGPATNPAFAVWQKVVRKAAVQAMAGRLPHSGLFVMHAAISIVRGGPMPDDDNVAKGIKDALQGSIIVNDNQGRGQEVVYNPDAAESFAFIRILAVDQEYVNRRRIAIESFA